MIGREPAQAAIDAVSVLPHQPPFLFVDRVVLLDPEHGVIEATRHVPCDEPWTAAHLPGVPIVPGVLLIEGMAQTCGILARHVAPLARPRIGGRLAAVRSAMFLKSAVPGCCLHYRARLTRRCGALYVFDATTSVEGSVAARAELCVFLD
jgi:3-hydroxyacyl-[acyl-carrier-protein] dehydratase